MKNYVVDYPVSVADSAVAYLIAVTSATIAAIILMALIPTSRVSNQLFILSVVVWLVIFFSSLIPYIVGIVVANRRKISHWSYFVVGGFLTSAVVLCFVLIFISELGINVAPPEPPYWRKYLSALGIFAPCGLIAGAICWWSLCIDARERRAQ